MQNETTPLAKRGEWLSARDLMEVFSISRSAAYNVMHTLPTVKIGGCVRVRRTDVYRALSVTVPEGWLQRVK